MIYHKNLGFPKTLTLNERYNLSLQFSSHALTACKTDRYGEIEILSEVTFNRKDIIEIETPDNKYIEKIVIRIPYTNQYDISIAILLDNRNGTQLVKTVWLNDKNDRHVKGFNPANYNKVYQKINY